MGFVGGWREGWLMYDGTIVVIYQKPGLNGDAYYTRKANYGLNVQVFTLLCDFLWLEFSLYQQIGNVPSNLRILDYSHGLTGSAHDARAFEHTAAHKYPDWLFEDGEFAWFDSAYPCTTRTIPVHKEPASLIPMNAIFDCYVAHIRIHSEHTMGALKGRFQCLRGLRLPINTKSQHVAACRWVTIAIILHNLIIDIEGEESAKAFGDVHTHVEEEEDRGPHYEGHGGNDHVDGQTKRQALIDELMEFRRQRDLAHGI